MPFPSIFGASEVKQRDTVTFHISSVCQILLPSNQSFLKCGNVIAMLSHLPSASNTQANLNASGAVHPALVSSMQEQNHDG